MSTKALTNGATVPPSEEENLFRAATGLPFRCGICGRRHKTSSKSLRNCSLKLARNSGCPEGWFDSDIDGPTRIVMQCEVPNRVREILPWSPLFNALHPSLIRELEALRRSIFDTHTLQHMEEVALIEALAHTDPVGYIRKRLDLFMNECRKKNAIICEQQEHIIRPLADKLRNWRSMPPERFDLEIIRATSSDAQWEGTRGPDPIEELRINNRDMDAYSVLREFPAVNMVGALWSSHPSQGWFPVLYDFGLIDGVPAISWAMRLTRDESRITQADLRLVTLLTGRNFLNNTFEHELRKLSTHAGTGNVLETLIHERKLVEMNPPQKHE